ncbi:MAG: hypothetical protein FWE88_07525 [Phycisphaerae bacterium]|nr:hypothetical protein [Phycisphaerae bacterium]
MQDHDLLAELLELAQASGLELRRMPGEAADAERGGSLVRLKGSEVLFLNEFATPDAQIDAVAAALKGRPGLDDRFLPPQVRQRIEDSRL